MSTESMKSAPRDHGNQTAPKPFALDFTKFKVVESIPQDVLDSQKRVTGDKLPLKALFTALAPHVAPGKSPSYFIPVAMWAGKAKTLDKENLQPKVRTQFNDWVKQDEEARKGIAIVVVFRPDGDPAEENAKARKEGGPGFTIWLTSKAG